MRRKRRIDRKLHAYYLGLGVIDLSQVSEWRRKLFAAPLEQPFPIDRWHVEQLWAYVANAVKRYRLSYTVCRTETGSPWFDPTDYEGCVYFRFQARRYPDIVCVSANNPDVI